LPPKPHKKRPEEAVDPRDTAEKMADAVSYLCRIAAQEGLYSVLPDLLEAQQKLERIASSLDPSEKQSN
jgi:hypothetical protein